MSKLFPFSALILAMANVTIFPYILYHFVISEEMRKIQETKIPYQEHHMVFMQLRLMLFHCFGQPFICQYYFGLFLLQ